MTYLQIVQRLINELGLSGVPTLSAIANNVPTITGAASVPLEIQNACNWIHDACLDIDNQWMDWKYLWNKYSQTAAANAQTIPVPPSAPRLWDLNKFRFRTTSVGGPTWQPVDYYTRQDLLDRFDPDNAVPGPPEAFTINPDNSVYFSAPFDQQYDFLGEFWQRPTELLNSADTPLMPASYHRAVLCRAAVMYGNREDAPEIIGGLQAEYIQFMDKLHSDQLEGFAGRRSSTDRERQETRHTDVYRFLQ